MREGTIMKKHLKKLPLLLLVLLLILSLTGCKSKEAKAADEAIAAIGDVTLDSLDAIEKAEKLVSRLEDKDLDALENLELLDQARDAYDDLAAGAAAAEIDKVIAALGSADALTLDDAAAVEQARDAYNKADEATRSKVTKTDALTTAETQIHTLQASGMDALIAAIGDVTLDKTDDITKLRAQFNALSSEAKSLMENSQLLSDAELRLSQLRAAAVEQLINAIGTVSWRSEDAIKAAQDAYNALSAEDKANVSNADKLKDAPAAYREAVKQHAQDLLNGMWLDEDKIEGNKFYYPNGFPHTSSYWLTTSRSFVLPYIGVRGSSMWLRLVFNYTGRDWVFFTKVTVSVDGKNYYKSFDYFDITRDNNGGRVWEYMDISPSSDDISMLRAIADSDETIVRFSGDDYRRDVTLTQTDKSAIRDALYVYDQLS